MIQLPPPKSNTPPLLDHVYCGQTSTQIPPPTKGGTASPQFSAHVYCGQTAGWIKMPLSTEVGLSPGHIVLDWGPSHPNHPKGHSLQFSARDCRGRTIAHLSYCWAVVFIAKDRGKTQTG